MSEEKAPAPKTAEKSSAKRSPRYPSFGLGEAISLARKLWDKERKTVVHPEIAVKAWGHSGLSGTARAKLATLRQYDLLDEDRLGVKLSDLALEILQHDEQSEPYLVAVRRAALTPDLFKQLAATFPEASNDALKREMVFRRGFADDAAGQAIKAYRDTLALAKLGPNSYIPPEESGEEGMGTPAMQGTGESGLAERGVERRTPPPPINEVERVRVPLKGGRSARLLFTGELPTQVDIQKVIDTLMLQKDSFPEKESTQES